MWCVGVLNKPEIVVSHFLLPISNKHIHVHEENEEREKLMKKLTVNLVDWLNVRGDLA